MAKVVAKLTKADLVDIVVANTGCTKKAATETVKAMFDEMTKRLSKGADVDFSGFGKIVVKKRAARKGINPATGEKIKIKATKVPAFRPAKALKEAVK